MLDILIKVNGKRFVDRLGIERISGEPGEVCVYRVRIPEGPWSLVDIVHHYDDGYFGLLRQAIEILHNHGYRKENPYAELLKEQVNSFEKERERKMEMEKYETGTGQLLCVHSKDQCNGHCVIHNPSDHIMKDWPTHWRQDRMLMERICKCGVGHPDPDDLAFKRKMYGDEVAETEAVHGCCGCCTG